MKLHVKSKNMGQLIKGCSSSLTVKRLKGDKVGIYFGGVRVATKKDKITLTFGKPYV